MLFLCPACAWVCKTGVDFVVVVDVAAFRPCKNDNEGEEMFVLVVVVVVVVEETRDTWAARIPVGSQFTDEVITVGDWEWECFVLCLDLEWALPELVTDKWLLRFAELVLTLLFVVLVPLGVDFVTADFPEPRLKTGLLPNVWSKEARVKRKNVFVILFVLIMQGRY